MISVWVLIPHGLERPERETSPRNKTSSFILELTNFYLILNLILFFSWGDPDSGKRRCLPMSHQTNYVTFVRQKRSSNKRIFVCLIFFQDIGLESSGHHRISLYLIFSLLIFFSNNKIFWKDPKYCFIEKNWLKMVKIFWKRGCGGGCAASILANYYKEPSLNLAGNTKLKRQSKQKIARGWPTYNKTFVWNGWAVVVV